MAYTADLMDQDLTTRLPSAAEAANAANAARALAEASRAKETLALRGDAELVLEPAVAATIVRLLEKLARGDMVTLVPIGAMLTTQEAADILNVSRPFLTNLLKNGQIPFDQVGSHRKVSAKDLLAYKEKRDVERRATLTKLARDGQEFDAD